MLKFYDCASAPSPRRVRIFIAEKGVEVETVEVDLAGGEQLQPAFRRINPYCTVPVLETEDGRYLTTSRGCYRYLEEMAPEPPLLGATPTEKALIEDLDWHMEFDGFLAVGEALRNSARGLKGRALTGLDNYEQIPALAERGKVRAQRFLDRLDGLLADRRFLAGDRFSAADITALVTVDFAARLKMALPENAENAQRWYREVSSRPSASL